MLGTDKYAPRINKSLTKDLANEHYVLEASWACVGTGKSWSPAGQTANRDAFQDAKTIVVYTICIVSDIFENSAKVTFHRVLFNVERISMMFGVVFGECSK